jgi:hypothetical protein
VLLLTSTTDKIQVVTGSAAAVDVHADWLDNNAGTITPGRTNTASITTATTTDVVGAPGASTQRNVKGLYITNTHASIPTLVTVQHTDGTNVKQLMGVTLLPGENLNFDQTGQWHHRDSQGSEYNPSIIPYDSQSMGYGISGVVAENQDRMTCPGSNIAAITASGTLYLVAIFLRAGQKVSNISFFSGTTASGTPTHGLFGLYDASRNLLASSADFTTEAWAANTIKTKAMTTPYTVPTTGLYYLGCMIAATTVPSLIGMAAPNSVNFLSQPPIICGTSTAALTTALPNPAAAITATLLRAWASVT